MRAYIKLFSPLLLGLVSLTGWAVTTPVVIKPAALESGRVQFQVETNVKLFEFSGKSTEVKSKVERSDNGLKALELSIPVTSLSTGMEMRDKHMREKIFARADGSTPDVTFVSSQSHCVKNAGAGGWTCEVPGELSIRGEKRPHTLTVAVSPQGAVKGSTAIPLSKFGIEAPTHAGIHVSDQVKVDFEAKLPETLIQ